MSVISFKIRGIQKVTGVVVTQNIAGQLERIPMVRVRFESGFETEPVPLVPTMNAILDLEHHRDTIGRVIIRDCLDAREVIA
ncbi:hypothetical protein HMPREF9374_1150 [Desmospora sp. 8437]|nr:hypothetical protein HMPREF9374_1150 [Desmospora sp. 8437]